MANTTEIEIGHWANLERTKTVIPKSLWVRWDEAFLKEVKEIENVVDVYRDSGIPIVEGKRLIPKIAALSQFVKSLKSFSGPSHLEGGTFYIDEIAHKLIGHYLGNDIYKLSLMISCCIDGLDEEPISVDYVRRMKKAITAINEFVEKLKTKTMGSESC